MSAWNEERPDGIHLIVQNLCPDTVCLAASCCFSSHLNDVSERRHFCGREEAATPFSLNT